MSRNEYIPFLSKIKEVIKHTDIEYTFRMEYNGEAQVKPGQFFEVSIPKFGEAPISVSGIGEGFVDLTIRRVGKVTNEVFERYVWDTLFLIGPSGNGFDINDYKGKEVVVVAGGTGVSPVRGVIEHFSYHPEDAKGMTLVAGFKSKDDMLFKDDLKRWEQTMNLILTLDSNGGDSSYNEGLVTAYIPTLELQDVNTAVAIVVGPPAMMHFSVKALLERGFNVLWYWKMWTLSY